MTDTLTVPKEHCELVVSLAYLSVLIPEKVRHTELQERGKGKGGKERISTSKNVLIFDSDYFVCHGEEKQGQ